MSLRLSEVHVNIVTGENTVHGIICFWFAAIPVVYGVHKLL